MHTLANSCYKDHIRAVLLRCDLNCGYAEGALNYGAYGRYIPALVPLGSDSGPIVTKHTLDDLCEGRRHLLVVGLGLLRPARRYTDTVTLEFKPFAWPRKLDTPCKSGIDKCRLMRGVNQ